MASLKETLELVITANTQGAVKGLENVGNTADKELGKVSTGSQRLGGQLQTAGAAMIGFGAVALVGLGNLAGAAEDARQASLRLNNSLQNAPQIADKSTQAFDDLADSLLKKTTFDDEAVRSGEALLIQFGLTKDQVITLTPLIADLAAKMGVDFETASKAVGKAVDGSSGALKKMGIVVDETAFKADHYGTVVDALKTTVGGFAEEQGKTFSGQLQILQNQLGELAEGVGVGVVDAFQKMFGAVEGITGAFDSLSPGLQSTVGELATFGSVGLIALGSINLLAGTVLKAKDNFDRFSDALTASHLSMGELATAAGPLTLGIGAAVVALSAYVLTVDDSTESSKSLAKHVGDLQASFNQIAPSGKNASSALSEFLTGLVSSGEDGQRFASALNDLGITTDEYASILLTKGVHGTEAWANSLEEARGTSEDTNTAFAELSGQVEVQAQKFLDAAVATGRLSQEQVNAASAQHTWNNGVSEGVDHVLVLRDLQKDLKPAIQGTADATENAANASNDYIQSLDELEKAIHGTFDPLFAANDALDKNADAQGKLAEATLKQADAQTNFNNVVKLAGPHSDAATEAYLKLAQANKDVDKAQEDVAKSALDVQTKQDALRDAVATGAVQMDVARFTMQQWVNQGLINQQSADDQIAKLTGLANSAKSLENENITMKILADTGPAYASLQAFLNVVRNSQGFVQLGGTALARDAKAVGGPVVKGQSYLVGERGPEMFVPDVNGRIVPNGQLTRTAANSSGGGGGNVYNVTVNGANMSEEQLVAAIKRFEQRNGTAWRN